MSKLRDENFHRLIEDDALWELDNSIKKYKKSQRVLELNCSDDDALENLARTKSRLMTDMHRAFSSVLWSTYNKDWKY